jgi:hypothetical protein
LDKIISIPEYEFESVFTRELGKHQKTANEVRATFPGQPSLLDKIRVWRRVRREGKDKGKGEEGRGAAGSIVINIDTRVRIRKHVNWVNTKNLRQRQFPAQDWVWDWR